MKETAKHVTSQQPHYSTPYSCSRDRRSRVSHLGSPRLLEVAGARPEPIPQECMPVLGIIRSCAHSSGSPANRGEQGEPGVSTRRFWLTLLTPEQQG